ncbi:hypothetical protein M0812_23602 [Anaeramoeba flamelloides]|uniref:BTB domain-containing protein n=1 Tax=Anaeramoeba flamelloides TaxID=1746091 RepID=A0AAV7YLA5_9EUKA|nr:hypothetical protein M0812_23602 [Anaeramoeba flamelloides]
MENQRENFVYYCSSLNFNYLTATTTNESASIKPFSKLEEQDKVQCIVGGSKNNCLVWKGRNSLEFYRCGVQETHKHKIQNETIKQIKSGSLTFLILTESGKVYCYGSGNSTEIPLKNKNSTWKAVNLVPFFQKNKINVKQIEMGGWTNYYVSTEGDLYVNGWNSYGQIGNGTINTHKNLPVLSLQGVERVWSGVYARSFFYTSTKDKKLYACGANDHWHLSIGTRTQTSTPVEVKIDNLKNNTENNTFDSTSIKDIKVFDRHSLLLTTAGKLFSAGFLNYNGHGVKKSIFTEIQELKDKTVRQISGGKNFSLAITQENELYGWGFGNFKPQSDYTETKKPIKIELPEQLKRIPISASCSTSSFFLYNKSPNNSLLQDFKNLYESQNYCDSKIVLVENNKVEIPVHKLILELRTGLEIKEIEKLLNQNFITQSDFECLLKWVYYEEVTNLDKFKNILKILNLNFIEDKQKSFKNDLFKLFNDEDSKNFRLLIKIDDDEDNDECSGSDEECDEIPVHKLILLTRSGLFREMFENISIETNQVNDYSGKSIDSLEVFIKYLYTNNLELTADHDPELIFEELEDSVEYYQLNSNSNLKYELERIKRVN